jgi:hypothetical protein
MVSSHEPVFGSDVELWIRGKRDSYNRNDPAQATSWGTLDGLLDDYRKRAQTGTPLLHSLPDCNTCKGAGCSSCLCPDCPHRSAGHVLFALGNTWNDGGVKFCDQKGCPCTKPWSPTYAKPTMPSLRELELMRDLAQEDDGS